MMTGFPTLNTGATVWAPGCYSLSSKGQTLAASPHLYSGLAREPAYARPDE